jgi:hypothetical protein
MLAQYQKKMLKCNTTDISLDRQASSILLLLALNTNQSINQRCFANFCKEKKLKYDY